MNHILDLLGPRSTVLVCISAVLAIGLIVVTVAQWDKGRLRVARRVVGLVLAQALLLVTAFVIVNQQIAFYASWSDLFGAAASR